jgi:pantothenate kinase type III
MLLAIDVGNTETVVGVFRDEELAWRWRMATVPDRTADELALLLGGFLEQQELSFDRNLTGVVLSSVVPSATQAVREMVRRYFRFPPVVVEPGVKTGVPVLTDNPKEVGASPRASRWRPGPCSSTPPGCRLSSWSRPRRPSGRTPWRACSPASSSATRP